MLAAPRGCVLVVFVAIISLALHLVSSITLDERQLIAWNYPPTTTEIITRPDSDIDTIDPEAFVKYTRLRRLTLNRNRIGSLLSEDTFEGLTLLQKLDLSSNQITEWSRRTLRDQSVLSELYLGNNQLSILDAQTFENLTELLFLDLSYNRFERLEPGLFAKLVNLRFLDISHNPLISIDRLQFNGLARLNELNMNAIQATKLDVSLFSATSSLRYLHLAQNRLGASLDSRVFQAVRTSLTELDLADNQFEVIDSSLFASLARLTRLDLGRNSIRLIDSRAFATLAALREIYLNHNDILSASVTLFQGLTNLEIVDVRGNPMAYYFPISVEYFCIDSPNCRVIKE